jgi:NADH-quinone oxidoreductase subunit A
MSPYVVFLLYMLAILGFVGFTLLLNALLGPKPKATATKLEPFECGATPVDPRNVKAVPAKYYAVAIVFILFDLETVFLFIWALGAQPMTAPALPHLDLHPAVLILLMLPGDLEGVTEQRGASPTIRSGRRPRSRPSST